MEELQSLLLVGCGKMGSALLSGWVSRGLSSDRVTIVEPMAAGRQALVDKGLRVTEKAGDLEGKLDQASVVVFAIKPQQMADAVPDYRRFARPGTLFLSIAAGTNLRFFEDELGVEAAVVRAMPNTPAAIGRGITVLTANPRVTDTQRQLAADLMAAVGAVDWVEGETLMDAVTAVSGSGPAYVFLLVESLTKAGVEAGLSEALAMRLARATVAGAGELLHQSSEAASQLRQNVTSPGGTTQAALSVLMADDGLDPLMVKAVAAAAQRGRELAS